MPEIELSEAEKHDLEAIVWMASRAPHALRAKIVLRTAEGATNREITAETGTSPPTVRLWKKRFLERGMEGLLDASRSGRPREIRDDRIARLRALALEPPTDGRGNWSVRRLAAESGLSPTTVHRILRARQRTPPGPLSPGGSVSPALDRTTASAAARLLEREREIAAIAALLADAVEGVRSGAVIEGPARSDRL